jgi:hypothetical protein
MPVEGSMVAIEVLLLLHVPPGVASLKVMVLPVHTTAAPVIIASGFTKMAVVAVHPAGVVYVMVADAGAMPETTPDVTPTGAATGSLLDHVPPVTASLNVTVLPWHTVALPVTGSIGLILTGMAITQPSTVV